jgi:hypothetical protein
MTELLKFGKGNAKLDKRVATFSIPAGVTCPGAEDCKSMAVLKDGKRSIKDGPKTVFRCFAASQEVLYKNTYEARQHNLRLLKKARGWRAMSELIQASLPKTDYVRIHVSGDFFTQSYFDAWCVVAEDNPSVLFYAYTKSLHFWTTSLPYIPDNLVLTASVGGKYDRYIHTNKLRYARVVYSEAEAKELSLPIDHDDTHAMKRGGSFALLIHGAQPAGSEASEALQALKKAGKGGYSGVPKMAKLPVLSP